jgi:hypothetical protein
MIFGILTGAEFSTVAGKNSSFFQIHSNPLTFTQRYRQIKRASVDKKVKAMMQVMSTLFAVKLMHFLMLLLTSTLFHFILTYPYFTIFNSHFFNYSTPIVARRSTSSPASLSELHAGHIDAQYKHNR